MAPTSLESSVHFAFWVSPKVSRDLCVREMTARNKSSPVHLSIEGVFVMKKLIAVFLVALMVAVGFSCNKKEECGAKKDCGANKKPECGDTNNK